MKKLFLISAFLILSSLPSMAEFTQTDSLNLQGVNVIEQSLYIWLTEGQYTLADRLALAGSTPIGSLKTQISSDISSLGSTLGSYLGYIKDNTYSIYTSLEGTIHNDLGNLGSIKDGVNLLHQGIDSSNGWLGQVSSNIETVNSTIEGSLYMSNFYLSDISYSSWRNNDELKAIKTVDATAAEDQHEDLTAIDQTIKDVAFVIEGNQLATATGMYDLMDRNHADIGAVNDLLTDSFEEGKDRQTGGFLEFVQMMGANIKYGLFRGLAGFIGVVNSMVSGIIGLLPDYELSFEWSDTLWGKFLFMLNLLFPLDLITTFLTLWGAWVGFMVGRGVILRVVKVLN